MTVDEARRNLQEARINFRKLLTYTNELDKQLDQVESGGEMKKANSIHQEIDKLVKRLLGMQEQLDQFLQVIKDRETRNKSTQERQQVIN